MDLHYQEIKGDIIQLALENTFNVIAHGCNCYCIQGKGIAKQMKDTFQTNKYPLERIEEKGNINKLGLIDYMLYYQGDCFVQVVNAYTQYGPGPNLDYNALRLCLRKINHIFPNHHIGLPQIGCGIAGGIWDINEFAMQNYASFRKAVALRQDGFKDVKTIIIEELKDCNVTVVIYDE